VDVELALEGPTGDFDLVLRVDVAFVNGPATVGAAFGQRSFVGFIDLFGRLAMGFDPVVLARLAAGLFRLRLGWPLGEGRRLAFAGAALFVEQPPQTVEFSATLDHFAFEAFTVKAGGIGHALMIANR